jgi:tripartite-type tricarboxylate transporter receptor subunit TctC
MTRYEGHRAGVLRQLSSRTPLPEENKRVGGVKMKLNPLRSAVALLIAVFAVTFVASAAHAKYPDDRPITLVCSTSPGSGAAAWCELMAQEFQKADILGVPVEVVYKPGGSNDQAAIYTYSQPADGHTLLHINGSYAGYFNLPFFKYKFHDFEMVARVEKQVYALGARCDDPRLKSWQAVVAYAKAHPHDLAVGGGKFGSLDQVNLARINKAAGIDLRDVPYNGSGQVLKDVLGGHLPLGFGQPALWTQFVQAGTICPVLLLSDTRLSSPVWAKVPIPADVGLDYHNVDQWQGIAVKKGTPQDIVNAIADAAMKVSQTASYKNYVDHSFVIPDFDRDGPAMTSAFDKNIAAMRIFMIDNGLLPKS